MWVNADLMRCRGRRSPCLTLASPSLIRDFIPFRMPHSVAAVIWHRGGTCHLMPLIRHRLATSSC